MNTPSATDVAVISAQTGPAIRELLKHWPAEVVAEKVRESLRQLQLTVVDTSQK